MVDRCEHCDGNGWVWQEYSTTFGGDYQKCHHCMKAPMPSDPQPTTWRTTPVCATEAMIEAGAAQLRSGHFPYMSAIAARIVAAAVINAALNAAPKPPPLPEPPAAPPPTMDSEFTDALLRASHEAELSRPLSDLEWRIDGRLMRMGHGARVAFAVASVALHRAAAHLRAEAAERMAGLKTCEDRATSHMVIGLLREMADDVEGLLPVEGAT